MVFISVISVASYSNLIRRFFIRVNPGDLRAKRKAVGPQLSAISQTVRSARSPFRVRRLLVCSTIRLLGVKKLLAPGYWRVCDSLGGSFRTPSVLVRRSQDGEAGSEGPDHKAATSQRGRSLTVAVLKEPQRLPAECVTDL